MKRSLFVLSFFCFSVGVFAQTDTIFIVKTDTVFVAEKKDRMYKFFVENRETGTNHLWKMNLVNIGLIRPNVGYEHRLGKSWSVEGYLSYGGIGDIYRNDDVIGIDLSLGVEFEQLFKYYYNLNRRERLGKKTYGFRGNYFASSIWIKEFEDQTLYTDSTHAPNVNLINLGIKYGIQRRIGNLGYIEFYAGVYYRWESIRYLIGGPGLDSWTEYNKYIIPVIGVKAGFAIDSFDSLRRMIKD